MTREEFNKIKDIIELETEAYFDEHPSQLDLFNRFIKLAEKQFRIEESMHNPTKNPFSASRKQEVLHDGAIIKVGDRIANKTYGEGTVMSFGQADPNLIYTIDTVFDNGKKASLWRADPTIRKID